jgi:ACR3 family arsenite transporter
MASQWYAKANTVRELAAAAAINLFGFHYGAELATVVGVLIEVPVMMVKVIKASRAWYVAGASKVH